MRMNKYQRKKKTCLRIRKYMNRWKRKYIKFCSLEEKTRFRRQKAQPLNGISHASTWASGKKLNEFFLFLLWKISQYSYVEWDQRKDTHICCGDDNIPKDTQYTRAHWLNWLNWMIAQIYHENRKTSFFFIIIIISLIECGTHALETWRIVHTRARFYWILSISISLHRYKSFSVVFILSGFYVKRIIKNLGGSIAHLLVKLCATVLKTMACSEGPRTHANTTHTQTKTKWNEMKWNMKAYR